MSTSRIYEAVIAVARRRVAGSTTVHHLDIGAGEGRLIRRLRAALPVNSSACDYHVERFRLGDAPIAQIDLNRERLPYPEASFDLVTCSEVIEHLENYRSLLRDIHRVLVPGGVAIITTPNVINAYSRLRYLVSGFPNLFGPLPVKSDERYTAGGHITPVPYFYLAHALLEADFQDLEVHTDKVQKTSFMLTVLLAPLIALGWLRFWHLEARRWRSLTAENRSHVRRHTSWPILVGRTLLLSGRRGPLMHR